MQIMNLKEVENLETSEGIMSPLIFGKNLMAFYLQIPGRFKVKPHTHQGEGFLYCLSGKLEVTSNSGKVSISSGTAMLVPPGVEAGVENKQVEPFEAIIVSSPPVVKSLEELKQFIGKYGAQNKG